MMVMMAMTMTSLRSPLLPRRGIGAIMEMVWRMSGFYLDLR
jgi:hypothetical protein